MVLNSVKNIIIGTYTAISVFLGTKKIFPSTSSYLSTYYRQSIEPVQANITTTYYAYQTVYSIERKTTTSGFGILSRTFSVKPISGSSYICTDTMCYYTYSSIATLITKVISTTHVNETYTFEGIYSRTGYTYYTQSYATSIVNRTITYSSTRINNGTIANDTYLTSRATAGSTMSYYTTTTAASYTRTSTASTVNSQTSTTTNGTYIKITNQSYRTTLTSNV